MQAHPLAGKAVPAEMLVDISRLVKAYYTQKPDPGIREQHVAFGTSGHRGSSLRNSFNEAHILAITQAICLYRRQQSILGPLFLGIDTHALSEPAFATALEVLAANNVPVMIDSARGYTPTPVISHAILAYNRNRSEGFADGIVITPSHNPPEDGGFKYNPPHGGPADAATTRLIQDEANRLLSEGLKDVVRMPFDRALHASTTKSYDYLNSYIVDLASVIDMEAIRSSGIKIGVDPLGGAGISYWEPIRQRYCLNLEIVNDVVDPTFRFMRLDWDGRIRMDCSSPFAMAGLIELKDRFDIAFGNDSDFDRHGVVTRSSGLLNPNHYYAAAIKYLFSSRPRWPLGSGIGKTIVSSSIIDRISIGLGRRLFEVPVGFKWFVKGLQEAALGFAGEESAGASFLRLDGTVWTTEKDGIIMGLLAAEMMARFKKDPGSSYQELTRQYGTPFYERIDAPATAEEKARLSKLSVSEVSATELAGEKIEQILTRAPGDGNPIDGIKVVTKNGWFAARPSGTENLYKIYAESFLGEDHLRRMQSEAQSLIKRILA